MSVLDDPNTIIDKGIEKTLDDYIREFMLKYMQTHEFQNQPIIDLLMRRINQLESQLQTTKDMLDYVYSMVDRHSHELSIMRDENGSITDIYFSHVLV